MVRGRFVMGVRDKAVKQKLQLITNLSLDKAMTIARQHEQVKLQMREQQLEQEQHVAEARVSPSPGTAGRYTKPKDGHTASRYRYSMSRDRLPRKWERCGYAEHLTHRVMMMVELASGTEHRTCHNKAEGRG